MTIYEMADKDCQNAIKFWKMLKMIPSTEYPEEEPFTDGKGNIIETAEEIRKQDEKLYPYK